MNRAGTIDFPSKIGVFWSSEPWPIRDAQNMARIGPMGMIFIPSIGGISHSPKEYSTPRDIENGVNTLLHAVLAADASYQER